MAGASAKHTPARLDSLQSSFASQLGPPPPQGSLVKPLAGVAPGIERRGPTLALICVDEVETLGRAVERRGRPVLVAVGGQLLAVELDLYGLQGRHSASSSARSSLSRHILRLLS